ncbi:hypothetical protein VTJ83DRAFT_3413 [Remersonia thermophila]|uniref:FAD-binding FR-type domain-containing protein n=1 Tax=Remersonia thermophila TaxID=72144 RepID=A0ABR4DE09_9PEZI
MGLSMIHICVRSPAAAAARANRLAIARLSSPSPPSPLSRRQQRNLHSTPSYHRRRAPPIRVAPSPPPAPKDQPPQTPPPSRPLQQPPQPDHDSVSQPLDPLPQSPAFELHPSSIISPSSSFSSSSSSSPSSSSHRSPLLPPPRRRFLPKLFPKVKRDRDIFGWVAFIFLCYLFTPTVTSFGGGDDDDDGSGGKKKKGKTTRKSLNAETFTPFTVAEREQVSPTAFILTLEALGGKGREGTVEEIRRAWSHGGLWAVEVKQPEIMVARDYTPLPDLVEVLGPAGGSGEGGEDGAGKAEAEEEEKKKKQKNKEDGKIRLYVRRMQRGEVSNYLSRLQVGDEIELRGAKLGFDLRSRIGEAAAAAAAAEQDAQQPRPPRRVVFLAGGTGIATALQAAHALLDVPGVEMDVVWANRRREDARQGSGDDDENAILAMLEAFRRAYGGHRFRYACTVDEEGSFVTRDVVAGLLTAGLGASSSLAPATARPSLWKNPWSSSSSASASAAAGAVDASSCRYHSPTLLTTSPDADPGPDTPSSTPGNPSQQRPPRRGECRCRSAATGQPVRGGKNLFMISGPEGFIAHFAGPKVWSDGKERQGLVGGLVGEALKKKGEEGGWLVLKM